MSESEERFAYQRARDERLLAVKNMIELEAATKDGAAFRMLIEALGNEEARALNELVDCDPAKLGAVAALQAQARVAQLIRNTIQAIIYQGQVAEKSLRDEDNGRG